MKEAIVSPMAKTTKTYVVRRGRRYLVERTPDGMFGKWIPQGSGTKKAAAKKTTKTAKMATKTTAKATTKKKAAKGKAKK